MPEHPGFDLAQTEGRSIVRLRVQPAAAEAAGQALDLPQQALQWRSGNPTAHWLGPEQWLLTSDTKPAKGIISQIDSALPNQLYAAADVSSQMVCFALRGPAARTILAMGCGIDMHISAFNEGQCIQTNFANVQLFIVVIGDDNFDLYLDRSHARYLSHWLHDAGEDPITRDSKFQAMNVN